MDFHETRGGHEFLYGTMPKLAREVERLANAIEKLCELLYADQDNDATESADRISEVAK